MSLFVSMISIIKLPADAYGRHVYVTGQVYSVLNPQVILDASIAVFLGLRISQNEKRRAR